jgi:hypothetical protein
MGNCVYFGDLAERTRFFDDLGIARRLESGVFVLEVYSIFTKDYVLLLTLKNNEHFFVYINTF